MRIVNVKGLVVGIIVTSIFFVFSAGAAEVNRIGVVDFQRILETSEAGKAAQAEIKSEGQKMEAALKQKGEEIEELRSLIDRRHQCRLAMADRGEALWDYNISVVAIFSGTIGEEA